MDRSNSTSSNASTSSRSSSGPFAYQTRLLERTSSKGGGTSLLRSNSANLTGSGTPSNTRRWTHRGVNSFDATRGVWEDRAREAIGDESLTPQISPTRDGEMSRTPSHMALRQDLSFASGHQLIAPPTRPATYAEPQRTPLYLKRRTMPTPIIASHLSPNTTGVTVENDSPFSASSSSSQRVHLPSAVPFHSNTVDSVSPSGLANEALNPRPQRLKTLDTLIRPSQSTERSFSPPPPLQSPSKSSSSLTPSTLSARGHLTSLNGLPVEAPTSPQKPQQLLSSSSIARSPEKPANYTHITPFSPSPTNSVMSPPVYRSSYMTNKKSTYGDSLGSGRRLGRHLPRIASGDAEEPLELQKKVQEPLDCQRQKDAPNRTLEDGRSSPEKSWKQQERVVPTIPVPNVDDVAGLPGRIQLKAPSGPSSPLPSARLMGSSWADTQRHLIHAYEYLCHVGEAQQWIEGCLGEELEFGVVELEDGLRNGVVLAKLVRTFQGENAVRKIYDVSV
ncbi:hypothetical protein C0995_014506 [Termitomyces sp. Mi166|nr:hypothetical protein C0995_014506 [Termitomyces sp. Mi166\